MIKKQRKTRVQTVTCPQCNIEFFSRTRHDYRLCGCPNQTMIDGGFSGYVRYGGDNIDALRKSLRFVKATKQELYDDWNNGQNKFGIMNRKETRMDNNKDRANKNRSAVGERSGRAKLTALAVMAIRDIYKTGNYTITDLGTKFGVSDHQISMAVRRQSRRHIL